jgi:PIN domain nuclease of toxin-antitoxin system
MKLLHYTPFLPLVVLELHKLSRGLRETLESPETEFLISTSSLWEIATKWRRGKLLSGSERWETIQGRSMALACASAPSTAMW